MTSGRLGAAKVSAGTASKIYTNTTGNPVAASLIATALSETENAKLSINVDTTSTTPLNYTVDEYTLNSTVATTDVVAWDDASLVAFNRGQTSWDGSYYGPRMKYSTNKTSWTAPGSGSYNNHYLRVDPYFITNPEAYGRDTSGALLLNTNDVYHHADISQSTLGATYEYLYNSASSGDNLTGLSYYSRGFIFDPYTSENADHIGVGIDTNSYMSYTYLTPDSTTNQGQLSRSSDSIIYSIQGGGANPSSYDHPWYAGMMWLEKGVLCVQSAQNSADGIKISNSRGSSYSLGNNYFAADTVSATSGVTYVNSWGFNNPIGWFKYNPNNDKYYLMIRGGSYAGIYELTTDDLAGGTVSLSTWSTKKVADIPHAQMTTPMRLKASLWYAVDGNGAGWYTTDFITWQTAANYIAANVSTETGVIQFQEGPEYTSLLAGGNLNKTFYNITGFDDLNEEGVLEYKTSVSNYERTGLVLSHGDTVYVENAGGSKADLAVTLMGFEDD